MNDKLKRILIVDDSPDDIHFVMEHFSDDEFVALSKGVNPYTIHPEFISHHWPLSGDGPANIQVRDVVGGVNLDTINGTPIKVDSIKLRGNRLF